MSLALRNVSLRIDAATHIYETSVELAPRGFNILLGTTLAGKTTLLRLMAGLLKPTRGAILFNGKDVTQVPVRERRVAMVYQQFINYGHLSVFENIASPLHVAGVRAAEITTRVARIAEILRLSALLDRKPAELSGGQQQRTALARALVKDADLVLLDEPLANLDYKLREDLRDELPRLFADRECTVVYATTEPAEAMLLSGHTATLFEGRVTQLGPTEAVYRQPIDLTTARVFSDPPINTAQVIKSGASVRLGDSVQWPAEGPLASLPDGPYTLGLRPHHVQPVNGGNLPDGVTIEGRVSIAELSGSESVIHFDLLGQTWVSQSHGVRGFKVGTVAPFRLDVRRSLYFTAAGRRVRAASL
ncbi:MAG TPA: ABC transporter ATP-binding protein [Burkholderiaceae bacterium]|nr:ABC transporter ATP-binding protein [Burkholderiaceae bacterium]